MNEDWLSVVGKRLPRVDGFSKVTGEAIYDSDFQLPGMLHGGVLRSPYPHARILQIDTRGAEKLAGVKAVITAKDPPGSPTGFWSTMSRSWQPIK
jgi:CO/xanthine dehydrogenase Mo-binding subunit